MAARHDVDEGAILHAVVEFMIESVQAAPQDFWIYRALRDRLDVWEIRPGMVRVLFENLPAENCSLRETTAEVRHEYFDSERPSPCTPTFALSHRFAGPDKNGFMACVCGAVRGTSSETVACHVNAPAISTPLYRWHGYEDLPGQRDPVEAEQERCERLGVEWVGPDVSSPPPRGISYGDMVAEITRRSRLVSMALVYASDDDGIVRLGCDLREADGVTPR